MIDPDAIYRKLVVAGHDWADKEAAADILEECKKVVLAELTLRQLKAGTKSRAEAEQEALALPEYREHIEAQVNARKAANRARVDYDGMKALMELRRSQEATRRAEANLV